MDYVQIVSNVGFPIAAFVLMFHLVRTTIRENTKALGTLKETIQKCKK